MSLSSRLARRTALLTTATIVMAVPHFEARAQQAAEPAPLPQITVEAAKKKKAVAAAKKKTTPAVAKAKAAPPPAEPDVVEPVDTVATGANGGPAADAQGDIGYNATRTSTATKTDTPLRNVPQSISVITDKQIKDQNIKSIGDAVKYVPGVSAGQGEGNRDTVIIRGQNTTADFFVDGVRDDAQVYRDFYNVERLEVLKGPNALIFGRGGGGGIINRVTKQADFFTLREGTVSVGMFDYKRAQADVNAVVNPNFAVRLNGMYEDSGSYRDGVDLERWGINPTITFRPTEKTRVVLGYEHFEDHRTADRGIPSVYVPPVAATVGRSRPAARRFSATPISATPMQRLTSCTPSSNTSSTPISRFAITRATSTMTSSIQTYLRLRPSISRVEQSTEIRRRRPQSTSAPARSAFRPTITRTIARTSSTRRTSRTRLDMGIMRHTIMAGAEFGRQESMGRRYNGFFTAGQAQCNGIANDGTNTETCLVGFRSPTISSNGIVFRNNSTGRPQSNTRSDLNVQSVYIQDQVEITRFLEVIGGVRHDRFDLEVEDLNSAAGSANRNRARVDELNSPRAGVVLKPTDRVSLYGSYSVSFLPFSGDQFSSLSSTTVNFAPEKFTNYELGAKWDITPALSLAAAHYWLTRENSQFTPACRWR